jgi:preprotein translocase subunit SecA
VAALPRPAGHSSAEGQFAVVERGLTIEDGHGEVGQAAFPASAFVDAGGLAILLPQVTEYQLEADGRAIGLTILRATGYLSRDANPYRRDPAGGQFEVPGAQCRGPWSLAFGLYPHTGSWVEADVLGQAERYRHPFLVAAGTNNEFGFDYLRDNMVTELSQRVQRGQSFAIVDEVDNILIDEARTPLIISGQAEESADKYYTFARLVPRLTERPEGAEDGGDYFIDLKDRAVSPTEQGITKMEGWLSVANMYDADPALARHFEQALRAHALYKRDRDYIVKDGEIIIVDEFTGRQMPGRRWSEGLHQAVEAKEGLRVQRESVTMATVTFQNYFRLYDKLAGMTGTAMTEAEEFHKIYNLEVVAIPTHRPMIRDDESDLVFRNEMGKFNSLIDEIVEMSELGRPVLVGTVSVAKSEILGEMLKRRGIKHEVLNAKFHEKESGRDSAVHNLVPTAPSIGDLAAVGSRLGG